MPVLHRQSEAFDERNLFLQVTLGLLSLGTRLEAALAPMPAAPADAPVLADPHPMELALLGAIATSERLRQRLAEAVPARSDEPSPAATPVAQRRPDALRRWME